MELRHLRYFVTVAEELHFTRAAERLHIGQPPLSQQIQALEEEVGVQLLERSKRWVRLTPAGKFFLDDARKILAMSEQATQTARRANRGEIGELRIGFTPSTPFTEIFPAVINLFRKRFPQVTLSLRELPTMRQLEAIEERQLDLGFIRPTEVEVAKSISLNILSDDPLLLVMPAKHRLANRKSIPFKELAAESFVMYPHHAGTGLSRQIQRLCREAGFEPRIVQEAQEASTIIGLVAAGCGVSILPESFRNIQLSGVAYRPMAGHTSKTTLMLAKLANENNPLTAAFLELAATAAKIRPLDKPLSP
ncbi:LysR substrate-binding domain-containing protein [Undibacterium sp.]|jgi:DNA-binding transcriptional LysR family regulator|uniref:LysR substrate-binding domain-containing protein n=1 Tax=Undibacterium sp. TaxID=1914977 RepID=UPI002B603F9D|nr:LysR substrate-binding domain-containing protein [Undibacterium sp.]HTD05297.1 LysR substrate-binding domain-containing protein [Undibacterium sp.]